MIRYIIRSTFESFYTPDPSIRSILVNGCTRQGIMSCTEHVFPEGTDDYTARMFFDIHFSVTSVEFRNDRVYVEEYRLDKVETADGEDPSVGDFILTRKHSTMPSKREMREDLDRAEGRYSA